MDSKDSTQHTASTCLILLFRGTCLQRKKWWAREINDITVKNTHEKSLNGLQSGVAGILKCQQDRGVISHCGESPELSRVCKFLGFFYAECLNPVINATFPLARYCRVFYWVCISMLNFSLGKEKIHFGTPPLTVALFSTREFSLPVPLHQDGAIAISFFKYDSSEDSEEQPFFRKSYFQGTAITWIGGLDQMIQRLLPTSAIGFVTVWLGKW